MGNDVETLDAKALDELRLKIGFSFQNSALYDSMTVRENLAFPLERHSRKMKLAERTSAIERVLEAVGLRQVIDQMPSELSGGQKKRS